MRGALQALRDIVTSSNEPLALPTTRGIVYRTTSGPNGRPIELKLDVYRPERNVTGASCLMVHGGSFIMGDRAMKPCRFVATRLVEQGITVASLDYRLVQQNGVLPRPVRDVKAAMRYWADHAEAHGADPARVTLTGLSAGGALALLALAWRDDEPLLQVPAGRSLKTPPVQRMASIYGVTDFPAFRRGLTPLLRRWVTGSDDPARWRALSPLSVAGFETPLLQLHGDADTVVPLEHSTALDAARRAAGKSVETHVYPGAPHAFFAQVGSEAAERGAADLARFILG